MEMDKIDIFDRYLKGLMTAQEKEDFSKSLSDDNELAEDFRLYMSIVEGIRKEGEQDDIDFAMAMKSLSDNELREAIGRKQAPIRRHPRFRRSTLWGASMAAMLVVLLSVTFSVRRASLNSIDNIIVEYNAVVTTGRGSGESIDIAGMTKDGVKAALPGLLSEYQKITTNNIQEKQIAGINLSMAYLKLHRRSKAADVLCELKSLYPDDPDFTAQCDRLLKEIGRL